MQRVVTSIIFAGRTLYLIAFRSQRERERESEKQISIVRCSLAPNSRGSIKIIAPLARELILHAHNSEKRRRLARTQRQSSGAGKSFSLACIASAPSLYFAALRHRFSQAYIRTHLRVGFRQDKQRDGEREVAEKFTVYYRRTSRPYYYVSPRREERDSAETSLSIGESKYFVKAHYAAPCTHTQARTNST